MMRGRSGERFALINKQTTGGPDDRLQIRLGERSDWPCAASDVALGSTQGATGLDWNSLGEVNELENSEDRRSVGRNGNQHVYVRDPQVSGVARLRGRAPSAMAGLSCWVVPWIPIASRPDHSESTPRLR